MKSSPLTSGLMHHQIWGQISEEIWDCRTDMSGAVIVMSDILKQTAQPSCCPSLVLPISPGQVFHLTDNEHQTCLFCLRSARVLPVSWQQADLQLPLVTILRSVSPPLPPLAAFVIIGLHSCIKTTLRDQTEFLISRIILNLIQR